MEFPHPRPIPTRATSALATLICLLTLGGCGGSDDPPAPTSGTPASLGCDDSLKTEFKPDADTTVLLVKAFQKGDPLLLTGAATDATPVAGSDLCMVKLSVGPGNAGPADAPSTTSGIGMEIWLPAKTRWNKRIHVLGSGGWGGGVETSTTQLATLINASGSPAEIAASEGSVSASSDTGHTDRLHGGSFAMSPDGSINSAGWRDFSLRTVHELAVKTKALATAYYGSAPSHAYFDGGSMGGRQAMQAAQSYPADYDGIMVAFPAMNWTRFITAEMYPQIVYQRDLVDNGIPIPTIAQLDFVSNTAISSCDMVGGQHMGYLIDPSQCRYDPTRDATVLCPGVDGNGGVRGTSSSANCVNLAQASALNKIWYGMTADGSVPDPAIDNGWDTALSSSRRWYGTSRGTSLYDAWIRSLSPTTNVNASPGGPFTIASDVLALNLQDPTMAESNFVNATGNGAARWKRLSYAELSHAFERGISLQAAFSNIDANNPDLSAFKARGGKMIHYHGLDDEAIPPQGSVDYYNRVTSKMGGLSATQSFYKFYLVPGMGHGFNGYHNGSANPNAIPAFPKREELFAALQDWVENGVSPDSLMARASSPAKSMPLCAYPKKITFVNGDPFHASSYTCS
ncbi:tannase/feruloyl esterase family alpha/beta hydrolase [Cupriavidus sp. P-10]|uniref:tannase/feruloyl esterase family alpha/beta hydrolase n=1 Tax=Cupriavidus sp. P-10 TaxID=2027911 RepID=UPI000E2E4E8E|nr:tannase/feruloyl esterase family alpha/beta hydrolase [Cupriavidus sp. P-10]BDB27297.1 tannase/feruloyl esterase family alpha/beta hydrolase [Cupriavidus sp. P-10]